MKEGAKSLERIIDKLIPPALLVLLVILILEFFFSHDVEPYHIYIEILDFLIISIFVIDLIFKYNKTKNIPLFFKKYWLEIIAVIPFFLVFRALEGLARIFGLVEETAREGQKVLHTGLEISKEFSRAGFEAEEVVRLNRGERFARFLRPLARIPRLFKFLGEEIKVFSLHGNELLHFFDEPEIKFYKKEFNKLEFKPAKLKEEMFNIKRL